MSDLHDVVRQLSEAMVEGRLEVRGNPDGLAPRDAEMVSLINVMIDALLAPMQLAGYALDEIAHGRLPPFVIDDYPGEYNKIKQNINTLLAILYGLHAETGHLLGSIGDGKLRTRGNAWDYQGVWKELIQGVNDTLDALTAPIGEAGAILVRLAHYDLKARMTGRYRGEHAAIRKAMNATAEALNEAISQVSQTVNLVSRVAAKMGEVSAAVTEGSKEQSRQLEETTTSLTQLAQTAGRNAKQTVTARSSAKQATESILGAKSSMTRMVSSMEEICAAADGSSSIVHEIDTIAKETGALAGTAVDKAVKMSTSSGGFGVVAQEIRKLSKQCAETASAMKSLEKRIGDEMRAEFASAIASLESVARLSGLLGVNAAIEAAHVEGAGNDFKVMTDEIHHLATRSADAARRTDGLIRSSVSLSKSGESLIKEIAQRLDEAVQGARALSAFADEISKSIEEQTTGVEQISKTAMLINEVTRENAVSADESQGAAQELEKQVEKLAGMVNKFTF
ncbi:methyl-accepting chemotaxis protein [Geomonas sp.]|uniref:methyl-accepting chemotaxis protein n=1 Tax=Geomonas sp. TaxID=2651584 RepID=UPI002B4A8C9C|nr:methyl-accepting chemotaxis protein [Geomonas sp.]HJV36387.1 methyl-accepting chemotaxis protein [Geomonas sp.]